MELEVASCRSSAAMARGGKAFSRARRNSAVPDVKRFKASARASSRLAGDVPVVGGFIVDAAARFRSRKMTARSDELLKAVIDRSQNPVPAMLMLAQSMRAEGKNEEAILLLDRASKRAPERLDIQRTLIELFTAANQFAQAEPLLRHLVEADPDDAELRIDMALNLHRQGKTAEAAEQIAAFRKLDLGGQRTQLWTRLRTYGLGDYIDQP